MNTIYTANPNMLKNHLEFIRDSNTLVLLITQYGFDFKDAKRYRALAPSKELFSKSKIYKETYKENWFDYYKSDFNKELDNKDIVFEKFKEFLSDSSKYIVLVCYCGDFNQCHRSIVFERLISLGFNVKELNQR